MGLLDIIGGAGARRPTRGTCFVHLGVSGRAERFTLERTAWNEASVACPDERGFQPQRAPIAADDGPTDDDGDDGTEENCDGFSCYRTTFLAAAATNAVAVVCGLVLHRINNSLGAKH